MCAYRGIVTLVAVLAVAVCGRAGAAGPPAERSLLPSGARLIVSEQHAVPLVVVQLLLDAGARRDPRGQEGLASLTAELLTEGTSGRSATQISELSDFIGASLNATADVDYAALSLTVLRKELDIGLDLLTDVLLRPSFPQGEVSRQRDAALARMRASEDNPSEVADRAFRESLFANEPYGHMPVGTPESVRQLTRRDVTDFYNRYYRPDDAIVVVVGDITAAEVRDRLERALGAWKPRGANGFAYPTPAELRPEVVRVDKPISQANLVLGHRGIARDNPDYFALTVMNFVLGGGGFTSRLLDNIRTKGGLAYSIASFFTSNKAPGSFQIVMQTKNASANDAIERACDEVRRIRREGITDDELTGAQLYLTGSFPLRLDSNAKIASFLAQVEFFNLGERYAETYIERIKAVTREDVLRVAQIYLRPEQMGLAVVANLAEAKVQTSAPCVKEK